MTREQIIIGTKVTYYSVIDEKGEKLYPTRTVIESAPWTLGSGEQVCKVKGFAGGVSIEHLDELPADAVIDAPQSQKAEIKYIPNQALSTLAAMRMAVYEKATLVVANARVAVDMIRAARETYNGYVLKCISYNEFLSNYGRRFGPRPKRYVIDDPEALLLQAANDVEIAAMTMFRSAVKQTVTSERIDTRSADPRRNHMLRRLDEAYQLEKPRAWFAIKADLFGYDRTFYPDLTIVPQQLLDVLKDNAFQFTGELPAFGLVFLYRTENTNLLVGYAGDHHWAIWDGRPTVDHNYFIGLLPSVWALLNEVKNHVGNLNRTNLVPNGKPQYGDLVEKTGNPPPRLL